MYSIPLKTPTHCYTLLLHIPSHSGFSPWTNMSVARLSPPGVLIDAMRKGYWIILDELNLAPTDVLEALNRLLDDNRELFVAETQEVIKAHPRFMLFATQNPPGLYGGRKVYHSFDLRGFCLMAWLQCGYLHIHFGQTHTRNLP